MKFLTILILMFGLISCGSDSNSSSSQQYSYSGTLQASYGGFQSYRLAQSNGSYLDLQPVNQNVSQQLNQYIGQAVTVYSSKAVQKSNTFGASSVFQVESVVSGYGTSNNQGGNNGSSNRVCGTLRAQNIDAFNLRYYLNEFTVYANSPQAQNFLASIYPGHSTYACAYYQTAPQGGVLYATSIGN